MTTKLNFYILSLMLLIWGSSFAQPFVNINAGLTGLHWSDVAWGDYDNDGDLDVIVAGLDSGSNGVTKIYKNNGNDLFTEVSGLPFPGTFVGDIAWGDYDADGDLDIIIQGYTTSSQITTLYENTGNDIFIDSGVIFPALADGSVSFMDFNNDGHLDILIVGFDGAGQLVKIYKNHGDATFTEINVDFPPSIKSSYEWCDYDNDGDMDVFLSGLNTDYSLISRLYKNNGDETFTETENSFSDAWLGDAAWGDYNSDGYPDILLSGFTFSGRIAEIYKNNGDGTFSLLTTAGLTGVSHSSSIWGDYDNDGDLDIFIGGTYEQGGTWPRVTDVFINNGDDTFTQAGLNFAVDCYWGESAWGDYDSDGDLDLICCGHDDAGGSNTIIYRNDNLTINSAPEPPQNLVTDVVDNKVFLSWDASTDNETPSAGLTYNAYLRTLAGDMIWSSMSNIDNGYRLLPALGNTNQNLSWIIDGLEDGSYFWSVQALDNNFKGSEFATEESFTIGTNSQTFLLEFGFQFISSGIIPDDPDMLVVIEEILYDNLDFVRNSLGQTLRKIGSNWVNGIGDWIVDEGYLVKMFADDSFTIYGSPVDPLTPIFVVTGFQFVSFFPETPMDALDAFTTIIGDDLDFVRNSQGQTLRKIGPNWVNGIGDCQPGEGYLIKMFADGILFYPGSSSFTCGDPFTDPRDGKIYNTVQIGDQCWMAENLNIGEMIIAGPPYQTNNGIIEKFCYENDPTNCDQYGGLYQWNEMMQYVIDSATQGICPEGWYLPTDFEWKILEGTVDSQYPVGDPVWDSTGIRGFDAGLNLKSTNGWYDGGNGTDLYGFNALPGGSYLDSYGSFGLIEYWAFFWSSTVGSTYNACLRNLRYDDDGIARESPDKRYGSSVRCLKDNGRSSFENLSILDKKRSYELSDPKRKSNEAVHFIFEGGNPAEAVFTIYIEGLNIGDEVAAFNGYKMVGTVRINSQNAFENELPVFSTLISGQGYEEGNPIILKVWSENNIVPSDFTMEAMYDSYVSDVYPDEDGKYSVVEIIKVTSIVNDEVIVYPNPATDLINIVSSKEIKGISVFNYVGQVVYYGNETQINTGNFESGVYIVRIETCNCIVTHKVTIK
jgi:uncharacterized protein (TIGR02145 family)